MNIIMSILLNINYLGSGLNHICKKVKNFKLNFIVNSFLLLKNEKYICTVFIYNYLTKQVSKNITVGKYKLYII